MVLCTGLKRHTGQCKRYMYVYTNIASVLTPSRMQSPVHGPEAAANRAWVSGGGGGRMVVGEVEGATGEAVVRKVADSFAHRTSGYKRLRLRWRILSRSGLKPHSKISVYIYVQNRYTNATSLLAIPSPCWIPFPSSPQFMVPKRPPT